MRRSIEQSSSENRGSSCSRLLLAGVLLAALPLLAQPQAQTQELTQASELSRSPQVEETAGLEEEVAKAALQLRRDETYLASRRLEGLILDLQLPTQLAIEVRNLLALAYLDQGREESALAMLDEGLMMARQTEVGFALGPQLGKVRALQLLDRFDEALASLEDIRGWLRNLEQEDRLTDLFDKSHLDLFLRFTGGRGRLGDILLDSPELRKTSASLVAQVLPRQLEIFEAKILISAERFGQAEIVLARCWYQLRLLRHALGVEVLLQLAEVRQAQGEWDEALLALEQALRLVGEGGGLQEVEVRRKLASFYQAEERWSDAERQLQLAVESVRRGRAVALLWESLQDLAMHYANLGRNRPAEAVFDRLLQMATEAGSRRWRATGLAGRGAARWHLGHFRLALQDLKEAERLWRQLEDPLQLALTLSQLEMVYAGLFAFDEAAAYRAEALEVARAPGLAWLRPLLRTTDQLARGFGLTGSRRLELDEDGDPEDEELAILLRGAELLRTIVEDQDSPASLAEAEAWLERAEYAQVGPMRGLVQFLRAGLWVRMGRSEQARELLARLDTELAGYDSAWMEGFRQASRGLGQALAGSSKEERRQFLELFYQQQQYAFEQLRGQIAVPDLLTDWTFMSAEIYRYQAILAVERLQVDVAFELAERARATVFLQQLSNPRIRPRLHAEPRLIEEEARWHRQRLQLRRQQQQAMRRPEQGGGELAKLSERLTEARSKHRRALLALAELNPEYASLRAGETSTVTRVQQDLPPQVSLVSYLVQDSDLYVWIVDRDDFHFQRLAVSADDLRRRIRYLGAHLRGRSSHLPTLAALHRDLFAPLEGHLHSRVILVPHQDLHYLPFAALWNEDTQRFVIEDYVISQVPSASILRFLGDKRSPDTGRVLVLGDAADDLPAARIEADAVAEVYGVAATLGSAATETMLRGALPGIDLLHLAVHGLYDELESTFSRLELADRVDPEGEQDDGLLELYEVYELDLRGTDLVVLSACESALGEQTRGDEIVGFTRAFFYAGSPAVISTLWKVDDAASAVLMTGFHRRLRTDAGRIDYAEALRQAQLDVLAEPRWRAPYYWAGFQLHGDGRGPLPEVETQLVQ